MRLAAQTRLRKCGTDTGSPPGGHGHVPVILVRNFATDNAVNALWLIAMAVFTPPANQRVAPRNMGDNSSRSPM